MRIALGIEYDGHEFYGWQAQTGLVTIQACLEEALSKIAAVPVNVFCAGRTDAGVHALGQVVHFDTHVQRDLHAWTLGTNTHLPPAIAVQWAQIVDVEFHARFSALSRRYHYVIYNHPIRPAVLAARTTWLRKPLDITRMQAAAAHLLGEQDFSSFRSSRCESPTAKRNVHSVCVKRQGRLVIIEIEANAFLHHMVRNIAGVLMKVGTGLAEPEVMAEIIAAKSRQSAFETAPATGLYLNKVGYPAPYFFPEPADLADFW